MLTGRFFLTSTYGFASFYVYTKIVWMMHKNWRDYKSTFFKLYTADYFFNLLTFLNSFFTLRAPQNTCDDCFFSFLFNSQTAESNSWFPLNFFFTLHYCMAFIQYSMIFLFALNRCSMVFLFSSYEKWWRPALPWLLLLVAVFPLTITWPIMTNHAYYIYIPKLEGYATKSSADVSDILNVLLAFMAVVTVLTALANLLSIVRLICLADRITGAERNLFFVSLVACVIQLLAAGNTLILFYAVNDSNRSSIGAQTATVLMPFVSDLLTLSHPWTLLYFSQKVRTSLLTYYYPHLMTKVFTVSNTSNY
ncbi:unnamed protein product [Caenorhabditis sp. 36 PRJEB53466]|nr:unnamed protein product [Caenorhabditis sp. 36 PRJEB53466]